jgi:hypothetical protein
MGSIKVDMDLFNKVHIGADIHAPTRVELTITGMEDLPADIVATMVLEGRRYVVQELRITRQNEGEPITSELIRKIPVQRLIRGLVSDAVELWILQPSPEGTRNYAISLVELSEDERGRLVAAGPTDETLLWVARIYVMAELAGDPPAKSVRETFGVPTSTASYWIKRARDRKILDG